MCLTRNVHRVLSSDKNWATWMWNVPRIPGGVHLPPHPSPCKPLSPHHQPTLIKFYSVTQSDPVQHAHVNTVATPSCKWSPSPLGDHFFFYQKHSCQSSSPLSVHTSERAGVIFTEAKVNINTDAHRDAYIKGNSGCFYSSALGSPAQFLYDSNPAYAYSVSPFLYPPVHILHF